jgi:hypothetical protein
MIIGHNQFLCSCPHSQSQPAGIALIDSTTFSIDADFLGQKHNTRSAVSAKQAIALHEPLPDNGGCDIIF